MMGKVKKVTSNHLFLPLFALALLLVFNAFATPGFFAIEFQNGQFYGRIIDILNRASILVILSMGMTFVIATGGIDISQGSVIAISGAICCSLIGGAGDGTANMPLLPACLIAVLVCALCGVWNGFLVSKLKIQPMVATLILLTAGRGIAMLDCSSRRWASMPTPPGARASRSPPSSLWCTSSPASAPALPD